MDVDHIHQILTLHSPNHETVGTLDLKLTQKLDELSPNIYIIRPTYELWLLQLNARHILVIGKGSDIIHWIDDVYDAWFLLKD